MEDYYRLLDTHYEASIDEINDAYNNKLLHFKSLPFLTENDKETIKKLKKANVIFNNLEYKKTYDQYLKNKFKKEVINFEDSFYSRRKNLQNSNYINDRIFSFTPNNNPTVNLSHNELLRPKNAGLSADHLPEFDKPLDFKDSSDFLPHNFDS